ncbi:uncharacterized protein BP01DRAFT_352789 [Aspergillus saccharolyticus JOP 1030-1]|uniref:Mid2 domain-containing protein n=1 Tax=Aspergillus saccharolyticus JOP 1030-1 TaxID=1450539 RepID=A0A319ASM9_9EURO|nr:hypothetical protein BP01DRAFT_352789 [Aspergillus saccharolyticus JOP 1030-1]PYH49262.1 hypothetical protein BP01DRAFT_352789 [Aspergillus saccharolyticus JOP 1030-1]
MSSQRLPLPILIIVTVLNTPTFAQSVLQEVDGQQQKDDTSSSDTKSISSKGMIILCTIVALVIVVGISFTTIFIVFKKRRWQMREALYSTDSVAPDILERGSVVKTPTSQVSHVQHTPTRSETRSGSRTQEAAVHRDGRFEKPGDGVSETAAAATHRGWGSLFSFGRTQIRQ